MAEVDEVIDEGNGNEKGNRRFVTLLFSILKYTFFVLVLGLFVVIITVITLRASQNRNRIQNSDKLLIDVQQSVPAELDWYSTLGEIRGSLLDEASSTYIVDIYIGYMPGDQVALQELVRRNIQIKEKVVLYFSSQYSSDVLGARNLIRMKNELREIINRMLNNKIREVAFNNLQVISLQ